MEYGHIRVFVHMGCAMEYDSTTSAATTQRSAN